MKKHLKNAKLVQIVQGVPGGFFSSGIRTKAVISHDDGVEIIPIHGYESIILSVPCTKMEVYEEWDAGATSSSSYMQTNVTFKKCEEHV